MSENKNKKSAKIKKPNPVLFFLCYALVAPMLKLKCRVSYDKSGLDGLKGPALILCPHISNMDFLLVALTLAPNRPTFVVSEHFMARPMIRWFLNKMRVISKKMFCPDIKTIMNILRARDSGNIVVLFPEGRLTCVGHSLQVTEGTAELVKKMGVDVYTITENGAYKTLPKWGKSGIRRGKIHITTSKLFDAESLNSLSAEEIGKTIDKAMLHDEDKIFTDVFYKCKAPALGLDGVLYKCPACGEEFSTYTDACRIKCRSCGFSAELDNYYNLKGEYFSHINDWYFWQQEQIDTEIPLESETILAAADEKGNIDRNAGCGTIYMDKKIIRFSGECFGEPLEFTEKTSDIKAFPISVGDHFDLYHKKRMYNFILQPEPRQVIKWMQYLDKVTKENG
ncbi:MAG: lysophospholipid acyltransferase family protein [Anaerovoracaceae bacterium]